MFGGAFLCRLIVDMIRVIMFSLRSQREAVIESSKVRRLEDCGPEFVQTRIIDAYHFGRECPGWSTGILQESVQTARISRRTPNCFCAISNWQKEYGALGPTRSSHGPANWQWQIRSPGSAEECAGGSGHRLWIHCDLVKISSNFCSSRCWRFGGWNC